jgi:hypothetical protein
MHTERLDALADLPAGQWNHLVPDRNPFLSHEFLVALERCHCVGRRSGWLPRHILCRENGELLAAVPMYLKDNSYGEFVFDWGWADAYQRHGLAYYPKLVSAIPYTPATGPRFLVAPEAVGRRRDLVRACVEHALEDARLHDFSSVHWLFTTPEDTADLLETGSLRRLGCQFHWSNAGYRDFDDFLATLTAKKRKNIRRERRLVEESGLELELLPGDRVSAEQWRCFHRFYCDTFQRLGGIPTLTRPFFEEIGRTLGDRVLLALARQGIRYVAGALSLRSDHTLYGRHWGCGAEYDSLHFELCYYQGLDYCIRHGLQRFEPGAQGEHKITRGFLPTLTESAHWIAHPQFRRAIADFLARETPAVSRYAEELGTHSPYRRESTP